MYLYTAPAPDSEGGHDTQHEKWTAKHSLTPGELDRERIADIDRRLGLKLDGSPMAANTTNRTRIVSRASVQSAIEAGPITADERQRRSKTRSGRKVARTRRSVDVRALPSPAAMAAAIAAIVTQPGSETYRLVTAVAHFAGRRPSEVVMLRVRSAELPPDAGASAVPHSQRHPAERIELGTSMAQRARFGRAETDARLRLPPRSRHHLATRRHATHRNSAMTRTPRRNTRHHLRRRPRRRRTHRQPTNRHLPPTRRAGALRHRPLTTRQSVRESYSLDGEPAVWFGGVAVA